MDFEKLVPVMRRLALEAGELAWRDLVDFHARHSCKRYEMPENFKAFSRDAEKTLPIEGSAF